MKSDKYKKYLKGELMKKTICIMLSIIFLISGAYFPIKNAVSMASESVEKVNLINAETPVANFDSLPKDLLNSQYAQIYNSEKEYYEAMKKQEELVSKETSLNSNDEFKPVWQTIEVVRHKDGKPVSNAVVIVDGVPRFANSLGQVFLRLSKKTVSLRVEADEFNPYIEFYDVQINSDKKIVSLKKSSDDISHTEHRS